MVCVPTSWPALPSRQKDSYKPLLSRTQPLAAEKRQRSSVSLKSRFAPLLRFPGSPSDNLDHQCSENERNQWRVIAAPQTLNHDNWAVKDEERKKGMDVSTKMSRLSRGLFCEMSEEFFLILLTGSAVRIITSTKGPMALWKTVRIAAIHCDWSAKHTVRSAPLAL